MSPTHHGTRSWHAQFETSCALPISKPACRAAPPPLRPNKDSLPAGARPSHQAPHPSLALLPFASAQGFNEFLTSKSAQAKNKNRQFRLEDRVFSLSSITSPGVRLHSSSASSWRVVADASCSGTAGIACMPTGMQFHTKASRLLPPCITLAPTLLRRPPTPAPPQTVEAQSNPTDQAAAAGVYIGPAAVPVQAARGVSQAPPPKRRY